MFCRKCGKEIPDDSAFCFACGTPVMYVNGSEGTPTEKIYDVILNKTNDNIEKDNRKKSIKLGLVYKLVGVGLIIIIVGIVLACVIGNRHKEDAPENDINRTLDKIEVEGAGIEGTEIDTDSVVNEVVDNDKTGENNEENSAVKYDDGDYLEQHYRAESILFGRYEQDGDERNGAEPIEWVILKEEKNTFLVVSKYILDCRKYNDIDENSTWEKCSIRRWLSYSFYSLAFNEDEKSVIRDSYLENKINHNGMDTIDKIFLINTIELQKFFESETREYRIAKHTQYAISQGGSDDVNGDWWLRDVSKSMPNYALYVTQRGKTDDISRVTFYRGVRPAIRLDKEYVYNYFLGDCIINSESIQNSGNDNSISIGIRDEVREAIDSYEDFIDSYCDFMKSYDNSDLTMIKKYGEFTAEYYDMTTKFDAIADMELNEAETLYYSEVSLRCSEKLLKTSYDIQ